MKPSMSVKIDDLDQALLLLYGKELPQQFAHYNFLHNPFIMEEIVMSKLFGLINQIYFDYYGIVSHFFSLPFVESVVKHFLPISMD